MLSFAPFLSEIIIRNRNFYSLQVTGNYCKCMQDMINSFFFFFFFFFFFYAPAFSMGRAYSITAVRTYVRPVRPARNTFGFRAISFEKISVLD